MASNSPTVDDDLADEGGLKRSITGRQLFFYTLGDVLGSGIYVLIGLVAAAVGGAFWLAFAAGVSVAAITGSAYAELVTKYPQAAGSSLYVQKAFGNKALTFLVTVSFLAASFAASGSLAAGFASYFGELWGGPPALLVSLVFVAVLVLINYIGITESVVMNMLMTFVELSGLHHRDHHRDLLQSPRARPTSGRSPTSASRATRRWRSSPAWRSPSSP